MDYVLCVSTQKDNYNYLLHSGYVQALKRCGWKVDWLSHQRASELADFSAYDLILWDALIPEEVFRKIKSSAILVAIGGVGDDLSHYARHADKISLAACSQFHLDEPFTLLTPRYFSPIEMVVRPSQYYWVMKFEHRFRKYGSPKFWRSLGVKHLYLPFASDRELFHPVPGAKRDLYWSFCGEIKNRPFIKRLMRESNERRWKYAVKAPELGSTILPTELNRLYSRTVFGINEQHLLTFGRELNQRTFDLGMSGCFQITDMEWLASPALGPYASFYAGKISDSADRQFGVDLLAKSEAPNHDEIHEFFRAYHSFESRLASIGAALGMDVLRGKSSYTASGGSCEVEEVAEAGTLTTAPHAATSACMFAKKMARSQP